MVVVEECPSQTAMVCLAQTLLSQTLAISSGQATTTECPLPLAVGTWLSEGWK